MNFKNIIIQSSKKLGSGYISEVYLGIDKNTNKKYAIKIINLKKVSEAEHLAINREINIQKNLQSSKIVKLFGSYKKKDNLYLVLEYIKNGNLYDLSKKKNFSENEIIKIFKNITKGINYLHSQKIVHRDIKPENILITDDNNIKICDLGFSAPFGENVKRNTMCGTREYLAPEVAMRLLQNEKIDIWCLGILIYELIMKKPPFESYEIYKMGLMKKRFGLVFKNGVSENLKKLISDCLELEPRNRPSAEVLLENNIFFGIKNLNFDNFNKKNEIKRNFQKNKNFKDKFMEKKNLNQFIVTTNNNRITNEYNKNKIYTEISKKYFNKKNNIKYKTGKKNYISISPSHKKKIIRRNTTPEINYQKKQYFQNEIKKKKYSINYKSKIYNKKNNLISHSFFPKKKLYQKIVNKNYQQKNSLINGWNILKKENPKRIRFVNNKQIGSTNKRSRSVMFQKKRIY